MKTAFNSKNGIYSLYVRGERAFLFIYKQDKTGLHPIELNSERVPLAFVFEIAPENIEHTLSVITDPTSGVMYMEEDQIFEEHVYEEYLAIYGTNYGPGTNKDELFGTAEDYFNFLVETETELYGLVSKATQEIITKSVESEEDENAMLEHMEQVHEYNQMVELGHYNENGF